jgi:hypothetical protein
MSGLGPFRKKYVNEMKSGYRSEADSTATRRDGRNWTHRGRFDQATIERLFMAASQSFYAVYVNTQWRVTGLTRRLTPPTARYRRCWRPLAAEVRPEPRVAQGNFSTIISQTS